MFRSGALEQGWMNLDYSPVIGESGNLIGVIAAVVETSGAVNAVRELRRSEANVRVSEERLQIALSAGKSIGTWIGTCLPTASTPTPGSPSFTASTPPVPKPAL